MEKTSEVPKNKGGRPKGTTAETRAKRLWSMAIKKHLLKNKKDVRELVEALVTRGKAGDVPALKEIGDRIEGKTVQAIEGAGGGAVKIILVKGDDKI